MRLAVTNDWYDKKSAVFWNKDGILRALDVLRSRDGWEITFFKKHEQTFTWDHDYVKLSFSPNPAKQVIDYKPDAILFFGDLSRPILGELADTKIPKAICYSGGRFLDFAHVPDIILVESKSYLDWFKAMGKNVVQVFGTNTELFRPLKQPKLLDAVQICTFAAWKRHDLFAEALGGKYRSLACGWHQPHESQCWQVCQEKGVGLLHHQMADSIVWLLNMSKTCVLTSSDVGGSQRSVLESMACGVPPIVMSDSTMTSEYVREAGFGMIVDPDPKAIRDAVDYYISNPADSQRGINYIKNKYSEFHYADGIKSAIESIIPKNV